jgi:phytoene dehydrogenase-like protein
MRQTVIVLTLFSSSITDLPPTDAFLPLRRHYQRRANPIRLSSSFATNEPTIENDIRQLLDETVSLYQVAMVEKLPSQEDVERLVCDVSTALATVWEEQVRMCNISRQLDQAILLQQTNNNRESDVMSLVVAWALQYDKVLSTTEDPTKELRTRLRDLQQLVELHRAIPLDSEEPMVTTIIATLTAHESIPVEPTFNHVGTREHNTAHDATTTLLDSVEFDESTSSDDDVIDKDDLEIAPEIDYSNDEEEEVVDIAIVGAGIGGLCAGAILNTLYGKKVGVYESHYLLGGCAHAFDRRSSNNVNFTFDSGPTIVLGCSAKPYNPLRQVLNAIGQEVEWIRYDGWGMIEYPGSDKEQRWKVELGPNVFEEGPLQQFGGDGALEEFRQLRKLTKKLVAGAVEIPAMAMRPGKSALIPLLRYLPALTELIKQGDLSTGTFAPFMDGPLFHVKNPWFRSWLDALAFSLSGLPAARTSAAAMAYVLYDMHRPDAALDYPKGGLGRVIDALVKGVEQGSSGSKVNLRRHVESIDTSLNGSRITGLTLQGGKKITAREGVIHNAPVWSLNKLIKNPHAQNVLNNFLPQRVRRKPRSSWKVTESGAYVLNDREFSHVEDSLLFRTDTAEMTGSFLHLHLAIKADGLDLDKMEAHYTVMDRSLAGSGPDDGPCGELNMIAVSNPCVIDKTLAPEGYMVIHAYGAGNEPYELWKDIKRNSPEYKQLKEERAEVLWRAVESIIPDAKTRVVLELIGSPRTHERFLRRPNGTYGSATEDYLRDGSTPYKSLVLAGDGIFPGIGIPAVALSGASAANAFVSPLQQWQCLDQLKRDGLI